MTYGHTNFSFPDPRNGPFQLDLVWTTGKHLDLRVIAINAATGEVLGDGAGGDEISHKDKSGAYGAIVPQNQANFDGLGVETLLLKTLPDGSDYKDYVYAIMGHKGNSVELQYTGGWLEVSYGGVVVETFSIPQGEGVNEPGKNNKIHKRYLFGCFKPGLFGHSLDPSVARFDGGGTDARVRMAELCRPVPSEPCPVQYTSVP